MVLFILYMNVLHVFSTPGSIKKGINAGDTFPNKLRDQIQGSAALVVFYSQASVESDWVREELLTAKNAKIPIIPYWLEVCNPPFGLTSVHYIDHANDPEEAFWELIKALDEHAPMARIHPGEPLDLNTIGSTKHQFKDFINHPGVLKFSPLKLDPKEIIGLPLHFSGGHAVYLIGRTDDTIERVEIAQLAVQITDDFPDNSTIERIANQLVTADRPNFKLRLFLVRGPLDSGRGRKYLYSSTHLREWDYGLEAAEWAFKEAYRERPDTLQVFLKAPVVFGYQLAEVFKRKGGKTVLYHFDENANQYFPVFPADWRKGV